MRNIGEYQAPSELNSIRNAALGVGVLFTIIWAVGLYLSPEQALRSWLLGFIYWGGLTIGSIGVLMLQYLTGGAWGIVVRRVVEAGSRTLPVAFIVFLPILFGVGNLYEWTHLPATDHAIEHRGWFMTTQAWILRSFIYFIVFGVIAYLLNRWSTAQDRSADYEEAAKWLGKATAFSGPTMVIYVLAITFSVVDWVMALDPHWFSTIWGLLFVAGWGLSCFCFCVVVLAYLSDRAPLDRVLGKRHFHDLGKLMLALTMVWAYFNFSQLLIIWSGNIPEETGWYIVRMAGGWRYIGTALILFHFAFPFLILLLQDFKRHARRLVLIALFILVMRIVDIFYLIAPNPRIDQTIENGAFIVSWMDVAAPIAIGGIWIWYFIGQLASRPLVPVMDPFLEKAIEHGKGH